MWIPVPEDSNFVCEKGDCFTADESGDGLTRATWEYRGNPNWCWLGNERFTFACDEHKRLLIEANPRDEIPTSPEA